ncbi:PucR family transcriptional regulator ligand-binding domain-containing protein [Kitasatospora sp. CM 4170]|uniref:PucR family transcriptional regulator n=1 Tax=Kitasatospora aburaviensis TaxID=67265 RepID=A0ABW1F1H5_9ACTN|nr:PucR family transcriptional regulator ligand-binding domain-containing protein [Kitasatospora sp. CM 4170]WNM47881.1 PucR family transcriptional regulator ligand-binding domain-containing protein [Kitasatospora sp. CM 4170]
MLPTVARVLDLEVMRRGLPQVVAGADRLERPIRWVHVSELPDVAGVLQGGELVLTTGIALPEDREGLARYVRELDEVGVAGLVIEFGRRYFDSLPRALVHAAEQRGFPLIALRRELRFVAVTEAVHALVVNAQLEQLRTSEAVHQVFNELVVEGAEPAEVVRQVARMAGAPVVLENLAHQVLAHETAGRPETELLEDWERRSRGVRPAGRTGHDPRSGWLVTTVGARGQDWGRLVLVQDPGALPDGAPHPHTMLLERGASALALNRLVVRDRESLERQTHRTLLSGILTHALTVSEVALRAQALGVPLDGRRLVGVVLRQRRGPIPAALEAQARLRDFTELAAGAVRGCRLSALVGALDDEGVGVLIALGAQQDEHTALDAFAAALRRLTAESSRDAAPVPAPVIAVGSSVGSVRDARRTLLEATQVADAALHDAPGGRAAAYYRLPDVRLRGLLHLLRDDARLQTYVERELGPLLAYDAEHNGQLVQMLRIYLEQGRNKSAAADAAHLSRPSFYDRLHKVERILGVDLDQVESCLSLHVALLALDAVRR